ncbi:MAG TPA: glycerophosphodiester phosphodiesterase [Gemmatimonadales bacterium]|nr:glycerophosphodiester phosphodiesterase [Gemmatimonadales bacterium]
MSPPSPRPLVVAHRGASAREVENSLAAFRAAMQLGADAVELDVHATADGTLIVHHDEAIAGRRIPQLTAQQVAELRLANGEPIPTLAHVLEAIGPRLQVFVEVKSLPSTFDDRLLEALRRGPNPDAYAVHAFDHRIVRRLGARSPALRRGVLSASYPVRPLVALEDAGATILWQERTLVDRPLVDALHGAAMQLIVWTVDDPTEMAQLLALGVDGICTNRPEIGRRAVDARAA